MKTNTKRGMTLVEVLIAMAITAGLCLGLYEVGWKARRYAEYSRVATEARALAKEKLEEIISYDFESLSQPSCLLWNADTNTSSLGIPIQRRPQVVWHAADKAVVGVSSGVYAEVHVAVSFLSPLGTQMTTNTFSILIQ